MQARSSGSLLSAGLEHTALLFGVVPEAKHCIILVCGLVGAEQRMLLCTQHGSLALGQYQNTRAGTWIMQLEAGAWILHNQLRPDQVQRALCAVLAARAELSGLLAAGRDPAAGQDSSSADPAARPPSQPRQSCSAAGR